MSGLLYAVRRTDGATIAYHLTREEAEEVVALRPELVIDEARAEHCPLCQHELDPRKVAA